MELNLDDFWTKTEKFETDSKHPINEIPIEVQPTSELEITQHFQRYVTYSRVPNKHRPTFINFGSFFQGLRSYLRQLHYYLGVYVYCFSQFFPGSTLIWGPTLIRNSRVHVVTKSINVKTYISLHCEFEVQLHFSIVCN